jgi:hypothetical protein
MDETIIENYKRNYTIIKNYEYITVKKIKIDNRKTGVYAIINKKHESIIGYIKWLGSWRQYCFYPKTDTVYSVGCLNDIIDFINRVKENK